MNEYKIIESTYYDELGKPSNPYYYIKYKVKFLQFWYRWKVVTHRDCGMSGCYDSRTTFGTLEDAQKFAQEHICGNRVWDDIVRKEVEHKICG